MPSQHSFYNASLPIENVSTANRPRFDQISDATKYVNQQRPFNGDQQLGNTDAQLSFQAQPTTTQAFEITAPPGALCSIRANQTIEEEDQQQSSHGRHQIKFGSSKIDESMPIRTMQPFKIQKSDFEVRSRSSVTASKQPSQFNRSEAKSPAHLDASQTIEDAMLKKTKNSQGHAIRQSDIERLQREGNKVATDKSLSGAPNADRPDSSEFLFSDNDPEHYARLQMERHIKNLQIAETAQESQETA